ncbi:MAG: nucleoside-diphosphate kinase [Minisyncoccota bacterium]
MERSIYLISPEGMTHHRAIQTQIQASGLVIIDYARVLISMGVIKDLSEGFSVEIWQSLKDHLFGRLCEIGIVEGDDAVQKLFSLCGKSPDPKECAQGTIRKKFAPTKTPHERGESDYWHNVIYCPQSNEEFGRCFKIASKFFPGIKK